MAHVHFKFLHLAFKIVSSAIIFIFSLERSENSQLQIPNQQRTVQHLLSSARTTAERDTILFRKRRQAVVAVVYFSRGGTGWLFFFFRRDGTERRFFCFSRAGTGRLFLVVATFWRDGAKSLHRPAKGGLNRPASRPCKALLFLINTFTSFSLSVSLPPAPPLSLHMFPTNDR